MTQAQVADLGLRARADELRHNLSRGVRGEGISCRAMASCSPTSLTQPPLVGDMAPIPLRLAPVPVAAAHPALVPALLPGVLAAPTTEPSSAEQPLQRAVKVRRLLTTCDYAELERTLPCLITDLRQSVGSSTQAEEVSRFLATANQTSASLIQHTAARLTGSYDRRSPHHLAVLGLLLLRGVTAASRAGDRAATSGFVTEAEEVAQYVALDQPDAWANFSPTNVALHQISAAVSFGDAGIALDAARPLMRRHIPVPERRAALWIETARAYAQQGRLADGYQALRIAETCVAQDVRRPAVRELVADMAARDRRRTLPELHHFSRRLGVPA